MKRENNFRLSLTLNILFVCMIFVFWLGVKLCDAAWNQLGEITYFTFQLNVGVSRDNILILQLIPFLSILSLVVIAIFLWRISAPSQMTMKFFLVFIYFSLILTSVFFLISVVMTLQGGIGWHWLFYFFLFLIVGGQEMMLFVILPAVFFLVLRLILRSNEKNKNKIVRTF